MPGRSAIREVMARTPAFAHAEVSVLPAEEAKRTDLASTAHLIALDWVESARRKYINLGFEGDDAGVEVRGSALLISELVANLLDNAIRYTPSGGTVTLRIMREREWATLEVEDSGPGIDPQEQARVFDRFYRGTASGGQGTGLGLAIVREIARAHDATIELAAPPAGQGLIVRVRFPALPANATST